MDISNCVAINLFIPILLKIICRLLAPRAAPFVKRQLAAGRHFQDGK